jgi:hypothetical protein
MDNTIKTKTATERLYENGIDLMKTDDHFNSQLLHAMTEFASQESDRRLEEYRSKLKKALVEANHGSRYPMANAELFNQLIDSIH